MERESLLLVFSLVLWPPIVAAASAAFRPLRVLPGSGREAERASWWRLWLPLVPAALGVLIVVGWALQEPDITDEGIHTWVLPLAFPGAMILGRALARALRSGWPRTRPLAGTTGLVRPRVEIDPRVRAALDEDEMSAVEAHELAHARHRDPLRIWLAQLACDLQWPAASARHRLRQWMHGLELARDEEARELGADGASLAAAVVHVARIAHEQCGVVARLVGEGDMLRDRIGRLLRPLVSRRPVLRRAALVAIFLAFAGALAAGVIAGDTIVHHIPGVVLA